MLIPDDECSTEYDGVACDVLIFPNSDGKVSDTRLSYQHRAHIQKHFIEHITPALLKSLRTEFVACHVSDSYVHPCWLCHSINKIVSNGATAYIKSDAIDSACTSTHTYSAGSCVISRDLFIELLLTQKEQFFGKAIYDSKLLTANPFMGLFAFKAPEDSVVCDIVVPFIDRKYLYETINGLLNQNNARCIIHVIDDCSNQNIDDLIAEYPTVRWYRNQRNIGQFMSVNNIIDRCETDFLVINDADDISEPDRVWLAITAMELGDADIYGSQTTQFSQIDDSFMSHNHISLKPYRTQFFQIDSPDHDDPIYRELPNSMHPLVHGSMVIRKSVFHKLGGYTDFGDTEQNKCGNDTEFMMRAFYSGCRFHIGQSRSMRIRMHGSSCINRFDHESIPRRNTADKIRIRSNIFRQNFDPTLYGAGFGNANLTELLKNNP